MKNLPVAIVFIAALGGVIYMALTQRVMVVEPLTNVVATSTITTTAATDTRTITEDAPNYAIHVQYRLFNNPVLDAHVEAEIQKAVAAFKKEAAAFDPKVETRPYTFSGTVGEYYSGSDIVSERIDLYTETGGAHGMPVALTLNYDAKTGETITLDRALTLTGRTLEQVAAQSQAQLKKQYNDAIISISGADPKPENYGWFIVTPHDVTFIFGAYQVVSYAAGMPEMKFSRK